jgi:hypothetical protein
MAVCLAGVAARAQTAKDPHALSASALQSMLNQQGGAVFRGLDKITARVSTIYAPLDVPVNYGALSLTVRKCKARPPEEPPEKAAFVEIDEVKKDKDPARLFTGWMFWSSPALNALEHPVYDVWLIDCRESASDRAARAKAAAEAAPVTATAPEDSGAGAEPEEVPANNEPEPAAAAPAEPDSEGDDMPLNLPPDAPQ